MILQRTKRHHLFSAPTAVSATDPVKKKFALQTVEHLLGTSAKVNDLIVLGMLTQIKHGIFSLEDPTGAVTLDLAETKFHTGLYTESCFVLAEGWYEDAVFHVTALGFPPAESAETSRAYFGSINFFGGPSETCAKKCAKLAKIEAENSDALFVLLSDVWLDSPFVMASLKKLFAGYNSIPPTAIVLMGNFLQSPYGADQAKVLREHFKALGDILAEYTDLLESTKLIFVPGPSDPGFTPIFPRPALPAYVTEELTKRLPADCSGVKFVSNPSRLQFCTQEVVLFREDIVTKMCRNCVYFPEDGEVTVHFAKTLITQGHLAPLPPHICPTYWDFDRSMFLYPLPDLVVTGDRFEPFVVSELGCKVVNPGSFGKNDFTFMTYVPKTKEIEESQIPSE